MAFSGLSFPALQYGDRFNKTKVGFDLPVSVVTNGGYEYRTARFGFARRSWSIPARALSWQDKETLLEFYNQLGGTFSSFLFTDPEYSIVNGFALTVDAAGNYPIMVPVAGALHPLFHAAGLTITGGGTVAMVNGFPVIQNATGVPTLTGSFQLAARFDMTASYALENAANPSSSVVTMDVIKLVEVFE